MNKRNKSLLIGLSLGDGYIGFKTIKNKDGSTTKSCFTLALRHSLKQLDYLGHKAKMLHSIFGGAPPKIVRNESIDKRTGKIYQVCYCRKTDKYFKVLRKFIYSKNNKKTITKSLLSFLTPEALALWYMDDGTLKINYKKVNGQITSITVVLYCFCSLKEANTILQYFNTIWNIEFRLAYHKGSGLYYIRTGTKGANKFINIIKPYIIPSMQYKINPNTKSKNTSA